MRFKMAFRLAPFAFLFLFASGAPAAVEVWVEAESYQAWNENGGDLIHVGFCDSASAQFCTDGVDKAGDWIQLSLDLPEAGDYDAFVGFQALEHTHGYRLTIWPLGFRDGAQSVDFSFTGSGAG